MRTRGTVGEGEGVIGGAVLVAIFVGARVFVGAEVLVGTLVFVGVSVPNGVGVTVGVGALKGTVYTTCEEKSLRNSSLLIATNEK